MTKHRHTTQETYERHVKHYTSWCQAHRIHPEKSTGEHVVAWLTAPRKRPLSRNSKRLIHAALNAHLFCDTHTTERYHIIRSHIQSTQKTHNSPQKHLISRNKAIQSLHRDTGLSVPELQRLKRHSFDFYDNHYTLTLPSHQIFSIAKNSPHQSYQHLQHWLTFFSENSSDDLFVPIINNPALKRGCVDKHSVLKAIGRHYNPTPKTRKRTTERDYASRIKPFLLWCEHHNYSLLTITEEHILAWFKQYHHERKPKANMLACLRCAIAYHLRKIGRTDQPTHGPHLNAYLKNARQRHHRG